MAKSVHIEGKKVKAANKKLLALINKDPELKKELAEITAADARVKRKRDQKYKMKKGGKK